MTKSTKKRLSGFTLIELLVVIAIIGVLASIVLASLNNARVKARDARRVNDIKQIQLALELFFDAANPTEYPNDIYAAAPNGIAPTYISTVPTNPTGGNYAYANLATGNLACAVATGSCTTYVLGAQLEENTNQALNNDIDGTVGPAGDQVVCADTVGSPVYCVQP